jgi:predicted transposase YbfD/YdcC
VSACLSSPIAVLAARTGRSLDGLDRVDAMPVDLLAALAGVADPRARRGVRHRFATVLAVGVCAVLAGARTYVAIAEWAHDLPLGVRVRLGLRRQAPSESTIRRILQAVDAQALDAAVSTWLATRADRVSAASPATPPASALPARPAAAPVRAIAIDGKSARGARGPHGRPVHLLAAFDQASGVVLGQSMVDGKTNEITAFAPLLDRVDIAGAVVTADALHTQHRHADYLIGRDAHYILTVKRNQPRLHAQLRTLPWTQIPAVDVTGGKGHGRIESRTVKLAAVSAGFGFPHARLAIQVVRRRRTRTSRNWRTETAYAVTDLGWADIRADQLADTIRGHWSIENRLHWIRDVTFAEDHSQIRTGTGPAVMATLRNLAVSIHRLTGATNIAAACRHVSRHPNRVLALLE